MIELILTLVSGCVLGIGFACGIGLVMKIDAWLDYKKHGN